MPDPPPRPRTVSIALVLLYLSVVVGLAFELTTDSPAPGLSLGAQRLVTLFFSVLLVLLVYLIGTGRSWARWLSAALTVGAVGLLLYDARWAAEFYREHPRFLAEAILVHLFVLPGTAMLFTPRANEWFREARRSGR